MALPAATAHAYRTQYRALVEAYGTTLELRPLDGSPATNIVGHFMDPRPDDQPAINQYGLEVRIVRTLPDVPLKKGDQLADPSGTVYTVEAAHPLWLNDYLLGFKAYART